MDLYGTPKVGGDILAYCGKCKQEIAHVIVAMVDRRPARVQCKTCHSPHAYRLNTSAVKKTRNRVTGELAPKKVTVRNADYWQTKINEKKNAPMLAYKPTQTFKKGDLVQHAKFGLGLVEEVKIDRKILVLFRDEERTLVHGMTAPGQSQPTDAG